MKCLMSVLVLIAVCLIFQANLFASGALTLALPNPQKRPGGCYEENTGHLKSGQEITLPGECVKASCESDGSITFTSCGAMSVQAPGCSFRKPDLTKPYPECCPYQIVCKGSR